MRWFQTAARTRVLAEMAKRTGLWLLPWACVLAVSETVAFAAEHAVHMSLDRSAQLEVADASTASGAFAAMEPADITAVAGSHWVLVWSENPETHVSCLTTRDLVSADVLQVHAEDLHSVVAEVCHVAP